MAVEWWQIVGALVCILLSGTFSGLTLGLMSLDIIDLRVLIESGTERERRYARRLLPVRLRGNWLLCTLLIGNTAVNAALAIITAELFGGIGGFLSSTIVILYIGEIIPQAVCHRFGLVIGAYTIPFVRLLMYLTAPLSFTTSKALDWLLGGEPATRYNKSQLKSLLSMHGTQGNNGGSGRSNQTDDTDNENIPGPCSSSAPEGPNKGQPEFTVVELPKISSQTNEKSESATPPSPSSLGKQNATENGTQETDVNASVQVAHRSNRTENAAEIRIEENVITPTSGATVESGKTRMRPLYKFTALRRVKMVNKAARKEKEREKKEQESVSSNPLLTRDEMAMLGGAFDFSQKTVAQVMTALDDVFMLEASLSLNFAVLLLIFQSGHSRVPVYDKTRENIIGVLFAKDLILLDPEDCVPIKTVLLFFNRTVLLVFHDTSLNVMLNIFKQGGGHMAIVRQKSDSDSDEESAPSTLGVVTLEDLIEEIIGQDIVDETDVYTDNISKRRVKRVRSIDPEVLKMFDSKHDEGVLSEKEVLVVASYLSNNTDEFSEDVVKMKVLKEMLAKFPIVEYHDDDKLRAQGISELFDGLAGVASSPVDNISTSTDVGAQDAIASANGLPAPMEPAQNILTPVQPKPMQQTDPDTTIYSRDVATKNAYLIINGRVEISAGNDGFISEVGPWTLLGRNALTDDSYAPDFTARVCERPARLLRIPRKLYRLMVQYSAGSISSSSKFHTAQSPQAGLSLDIGNLPAQRYQPGFSIDMGNLPSRGLNEESKKRNKSSLALAAAATALAVGSPSNEKEGPRLAGSASDAVIIRKSRARTGGKPIEWSEIGPAQTTVVAPDSTAKAVTLPKNQTPPSTTSIEMPIHRTRTAGKPPSSGDKMAPK